MHFQKRFCKCYCDHCEVGLFWKCVFLRYKVQRSSKNLENMFLRYNTLSDPCTKLKSSIPLYCVNRDFFDVSISFFYNLTFYKVHQLKLKRLWYRKDNNVNRIFILLFNLMRREDVSWRHVSSLQLLVYWVMNINDTQTPRIVNDPHMISVDDPHIQ